MLKGIRCVCVSIKLKETFHSCCSFWWHFANGLNDSINEAIVLIVSEATGSKYAQLSSSYVMINMRRKRIDKKKLREKVFFCSKILYQNCDIFASPRKIYWRLFSNERRLINFLLLCASRWMCSVWWISISYERQEYKLFEQ